MLNADNVPSSRPSRPRLGVFDTLRLSPSWFSGTAQRALARTFPLQRCFRECLGRRVVDILRQVQAVISVTVAHTLSG